MNLKEIEEMIKLMNENKLTELELERNGLKIKLKKENAAIKKIVEGVPSKEGPQKENFMQENEIKQENIIEIKAPMVGTFYRAPSPEASSFVELGQVIKPDDVLCIVEAMKLMNEIKSEVKGKIIEILCENGDPVEFGQTLFILEPVV